MSELARTLRDNERLIHTLRELRTEAEAERDALRARVAKLEAALVEVGDFLADDCIENYPFDRIPGSFADEADRLLKLIKASVGDTPQ